MRSGRKKRGLGDMKQSFVVVRDQPEVGHEEKQALSSTATRSPAGCG
jgi:hypothetical protein